MLSVKNLSYQYPHTKIQAIKNISFAVQSGDYIAILGENGSGKSTIANLITGFLESENGMITYDNCLTEKGAIGIVFQSPKDQIVADIVYRDTAFGPENIQLLSSIIVERVNEALTQTQLYNKYESKTAHLSLGQKQKLALAGIIALHPHILILDEVLSMLDENARSQLLNFFDDCNKNGQTIIHVTHDVDEARRAKKILAIRNGECIFYGKTQDFFLNTVLKTELFGTPLTKTVLNNTPVLFEPSLILENINFHYLKNQPIFKNLNLTFFKGELTAIMGESGSGKSTLFELAAGLLMQQNGKIYADDTPALALQETEIAIFEEYVADEIAYGPKNQNLAKKEVLERVKLAMELSCLPFNTFANKEIRTLSGGQKRRLALAGIIALKKQIYFFDEPTNALDPIAQKHVMRTLEKLVEQGKTVIFSTHKKNEAEFADRCIVFSSTGEIQSDVSKNIHKHIVSNANTLKQLPIRDVKLLDNLRSKSQGLYKKQKSIIHHQNPLTKWIIFLTLLIPSFIINRPLILCIIIILNIVFYILTKTSLVLLVKTFLKLSPWVVFFALLQLIFFPATKNEPLLWHWNFLTITPSKITIILQLILHVGAIIPLILGFLSSTDETDMLDGLRTLLSPLDVLGIKSANVALAVNLIFRFIPILTEEASLIIKTQYIREGFQKKRGLFSTIRSLLPLFVPLILQTLKRAKALANTLEARYF